MRQVGVAWLNYFNVIPPQIPMFKEPSVSDLDDMFRMFPDSKAIVILRDGRDILCSQLKSGYGLPSISLGHPSTLRRLFPGEDLKILVKQLARSSQFLSEFLDNNQMSELGQKFITVKYEDLVIAPQYEVPKILGWLGLDESSYDWGKFQAMPVRGSSFLRDQNGEINFSQGVARGNEFSPIKRWDNWNLSMLSYYNKKLGHYFARFGYPL